MSSFGWEATNCGTTPDLERQGSSLFLYGMGDTASCVATASIAHQVSCTHKPLHHDKMGYS
jgi:hypothetical protein